MEVVVDLGTGVVALQGWQDLGSLAIRTASGPDGGETGPGSGALGALAAALGLHHIGVVDPAGDVLVAPDVLRRLATEAAAAEGRSPDAEWESAFGAMLAYADSNGWTAADGALRAHVEWGDS